MQHVDEDEIETINLEDEESELPPVSQTGVVSAVENSHERKKLRRLILILIAIAGMLTFVRGIELQRFVADLTAATLIAAAAIKFADLEAFAELNRNYDIIAKKFYTYSYVLPFIMAFLGFWYILSDPPTRLDIILMVLSGVRAIGFIAAFSKKYRRQYAYHKKYLRLPFIRVSVIENVSLLLLASISLIV